MQSLLGRRQRASRVPCLQNNRMCSATDFPELTEITEKSFIYLLSYALICCGMRAKGNVIKAYCPLRLRTQRADTAFAYSKKTSLWVKQYQKISSKQIFFEENVLKCCVVCSLTVNSSVQTY